MSKEQKQTKQPRKVEVKTFVPWMIILVIIVALAGTALGWVIRSDQLSQIKAEVSEQVKSVSVKKQ